MVNILLTLALGTLVYLALRDSPISTVYNEKISLLQTGLVDGIYGSQTVSNAGVEDQVLGTGKRTSKRPVLVNKSAFPYISAKAHLIIDNNSGAILSEHSINTTFAPASTTKLMTALVSNELYGMNEIVEISSICTEIESSKLWFPVGSKYEVKDLLYSLLVSSAGDAGCALASSKLNMSDFVELMNEKAASIGMSNSHFTNPVGLDGENGSHYASVWDLYLLSQKIVEDPLLRDIVRTKTYSFTDVTGEIPVNISNTNKLLWDIPETAGIKTGTTSGAGEVLIYRYLDKDKDFTIIVMSSEDRFLDTRNLINWTLSNYEWR